MKRHIFIWTLLLTLIIGAGVASAVELLDPRIINLAEEFGMEVGRYGGTMTCLLYTSHRSQKSS